jgi:hypothetical protein
MTECWLWQVRRLPGDLRPRQPMQRRRQLLLLGVLVVQYWEELLFRGVVNGGSSFRGAAVMLGRRRDYHPVLLP